MMMTRIIVVELVHIAYSVEIVDHQEVDEVIARMVMKEEDYLVASSI
jgi:hypothetical protein